MMEKTILLSLFLLSTCAQVNQESALYYQSKNGEDKTIFRHGLIPLEQKSGSVSFDRTAPTAKSVELGKSLYESHCMSCHGDKGLGDGEKASELEKIVPNLRKTVAQVPNFDFFILFSSDQAKMPGWKTKFTKEELKSITAYLKTFNE